MRLFPRELDIDQTTGFKAQLDLFKRNELASGLTSLITSSSDPLVLALDGGWGTGKTTFLKMWAGQLRNQGFPVVVFDAFKHDYIDDPFSAIAGAIFAIAEEKVDNATANKFGKYAVNAAKIIARSSLKIGLKVATGISLDAAGMDFSKEIADETSSVFDKHLGELITRQKDQERTLTEFGAALSALALGLGKESKPLVFIIDELDRCRPAFALETLERIKHFFAVPNVHFVLGVHMGQMQNCVRTVYGTSDEADTYLEKLVHLVIRFYENKIEDPRCEIERYLAFLCKETGLYDLDQMVAENTVIQLTHYFSSRKWNLRQAQKTVAQIVLTFSAFSKNLNSVKDLTILLCYLKTCEIELYKSARSGNATYDEMRVALGLSRQFEKHDSFYQSMFHFYFNPNCGPDIKDKYYAMALRGDPLSTVSRVATNYVDVLRISSS